MDSLSPEENDGKDVFNNDNFCIYVQIKIPWDCCACKCIYIYIIAQVILAFWLVLAYDPLEDRRTNDVTITKLFHLCFKMAERFENSNNILCVWAKIIYKKRLVEALNRYAKQKEVRKKPFLFKKTTRREYSSGLKVTNPINKMFIT